MGHDNGEMGIVGFKIPKMNQAYVRVTVLVFKNSSRVNIHAQFKNLCSYIQEQF